METDKKWKARAHERLTAKVVHRHRSGSAIARVETMFEEIKEARQRGMTWRDIADALSDDQGDGSVKPEAARSAFERVCRNRGEPKWGARRTGRTGKPIGRRAAAAPRLQAATENAESGPANDLFNGASRFGREVDDGN